MKEGIWIDNNLHPLQNIKETRYTYSVLEMDYESAEKILARFAGWARAYSYDCCKTKESLSDFLDSWGAHSQLFIKTKEM